MVSERTNPNDKIGPSAGERALLDSDTRIVVHKAL